jgi:gliding motility-associated-like protein
MKTAALQKIFCLVLVVNFTMTSILKAQTPANCLEIESILADACGTPEGENEMVRFKIGPAPINISNLSASWPNGTFLGISPVNATTNNIVTALNATILSCGYLVQPVGGMLPAGKTVLLITSTNVSLSANSFANLTDTLYVIFQNAGNTAGHFVNYSSTPGLRTLVLSTISPACSDAVTYDRSLLVNQSGGHGGSSALNDGATIEYTWPGVAGYINNGCMAPIATLSSDAGSNASTCGGGTVVLSGSASGNYTGVIWQGGQGSFSAATNLNTNYTASPAESGSIILSLGVIGHCNDTVFSTVTITVNPLPAPVITPSGSTTFCQGNSLTLTASGGSSYSWSTGATGTNISVSASGTYTLTATNSCGSQTATQTVTVDPLPTAAIASSGATSFCSGDSVTLYASGIGSYSWSTGAATDSITVYATGTYMLTSANACGSQTATQAVTVNPSPAAVITASGSTVICPGDSVILTASGTGSFSWSTGSTASSITVLSAGTYTLTATTSCGAQTATQTVSTSSSAIAVIHASATSFCAGSNLLLYATGSGNFLWSNGSVNDSIFVTTGGTYTVNSTISCGSATDAISLSLLALPSASIAASGTTFLCPGNSVTLTGSGGSSYVWLPSGATSSSFTTSAAGVYQLAAGNSCGTDTASVSVTALNYPDAVITSAGSMLICAGNSVTLNAAGGDSFEWSGGQTGSSISAEAEGMYWVTATNACGSDSASVYVNVDSVMALFTANTLSGIAPLAVDFTNNSSASASGFSWDLGDNTLATGVSASNIYQDPGAYPVTLTATNAAGCSDTYTLTIIVTEGASMLQMPNVFTPNGDGINDQFAAIGFGISRFECRIYDRWGIEITKLSTFKSNWDGRTTAGIMSADGTYYYVVKASGSDGKEYGLKGFVELINQ